MSHGWDKRRYTSQLDFWRAFAHDKRGAFALEFGLCAIPFFGLVFAFCEASYINYEADAVQAAVTAAARQALVGNAQVIAPTRAQFLNQYICTKTSGFPAGLPCDNQHVIFDIRKAADFLSADTRNDFYTQNTTDPNSTALCYDLGSPSTIVVLRVAYALPAVFPLSIFTSAATVSNVPGLSGSYHILLAADAFKTEPYPGGTYTPPVNPNNAAC